MARPKKEESEKVVRQCVSIDPELLRQVVAYCQVTDRTIAWVFKKSVESFLKSQNIGM